LKQPRSTEEHGKFSRIFTLLPVNPKTFQHPPSHHQPHPKTFQLPPSHHQPYPVKLCIPAPMVESRAPIRITHLLGQAISATSNTLPILWPNLFTKNILMKFWSFFRLGQGVGIPYLSRSSAPSIVPAKNRTDVRSVIRC
jgi:hypothetical protein